MRISSYFLLVLCFFTVVRCNKDEPTPAPIIDYFTPGSGKPGTLVTIKGKNFGDDPLVFINEVPVSRIRQSKAEQIIFEVPSEARNGKIKVSNGSASGISSYTFHVYLPPIIHSISPESGNTSTPVTITGENFTENSYVVFGDAPTIAYSITGTSLKVNVPEDAVPGKLTLVTMGGAVTADSDFIANPAEIYGVTSEFTKLPFYFSSKGHRIELTGIFHKNVSKNIVRMNGLIATQSYSTENKILITAPNGVTTGKISVTVGVLTKTFDQVIQIPDGEYQRTTDFPGERRIRAQVFVIGNDAYCGTGLNPVGNILLKDFWKFNSQTKVWSRIADLPSTGKYAAIAFAINGKGYVGGGNVTNDFWEYDPATDTWNQKADIPESIYRQGFSANGKGYAFSHLNCHMWEYDPTADTWTQKSSPPGNCQGDGAAFVIDDKIYMGAGGSARQLLEYDPSTDGWTPKTGFPGPAMTEPISFSLNGEGYCGAGINEEDMWKYNAQQDAWYQCIPFATSGLSHQSSINVSFTIGNKAYVGLNGGVSGLAK